MPDEPSFVDQCRELLQERWDQTCAAFVENRATDPLGGDRYAEFRCLILESLRSRTKSYKYVLPTQLLSKAVDQSLDCRSLQASNDTLGAFDARTIAHKVIVPFDLGNHNVLGESPEPYVNNPLRCRAVTPEFRARQKDKEGWDRLISVLDKVERTNNHDFTLRVLDQVLYYIYTLLDEVRVNYPTPNRLSMEKTLKAINLFVQVRSGGDIIEAIATSFFRTIGSKFQIYDQVLRASVNTSDTSSGMLADIECYKNNEIVFIAEIKDRNLTLTELLGKIEVARANHLSELLFVVQDGFAAEQMNQIHERILDEFNSGINIYVIDLQTLITPSLILLGERGRSEFIRKIGEELEAGKTAVVHRKKWAQILRDL